MPQSSFNSFTSDSTPGFVSQRSQHSAQRLHALLLWSQLSALLLPFSQLLQDINTSVNPEAIIDRMLFPRAESTLLKNTSLCLAFFGILFDLGYD